MIFINTRKGWWVFLVWNVCALAAAILLGIKLSGAIQGKYLMTYLIVGYAFGGLKFGAYFAARFNV